LKTTDFSRYICDDTLQAVVFMSGVFFINVKNINVKIVQFTFFRGELNFYS